MIGRHILHVVFGYNGLIIRTAFAQRRLFSSATVNPCTGAVSRRKLYAISSLIQSVC